MMVSLISPLTALESGGKSLFLQPLNSMEISLYRSTQSQNLKDVKPPTKVNHFPSDTDLKEGDLFSSHLLALREW